jgi:histone-lysine N-methyltransferase SETMAR
MAEISTHIRHVLLFLFDQKKNAADALRTIQQVYPKEAPSERQCQRWFQRFREGNRVLEDEQRSGQPKKFEDEALFTLLEENSEQTQMELAEQLGVGQQGVSKRLRKLGMVGPLIFSVIFMLYDLFNRFVKYPDGCHMS